MTLKTVCWQWLPCWHCGTCEGNDNQCERQIAVCDFAPSVCRDKDMPHITAPLVSTNRMFPLPKWINFYVWGTHVLTVITFNILIARMLNILMCASLTCWEENGRLTYEYCGSEFGDHKWCKNATMKSDTSRWYFYLPWNWHAKTQGEKKLEHSKK